MKENLFSVDSNALIQAFPDVQFETALGEGGQKYVYRARTLSEGLVAFKVIKANQQMERTMREINAATNFSPPRFPQIYRYGDAMIGDINVVYIVEEHIDGMSLRDRIQLGSIDQSEVLKIGIQLLEALVEISKKNLVHRDIKPENIIISNKVGAVLLDFGIARHLDLNSLTHDIAMFGPMTPGYAAPEQINNEKRSISVRTDLFAWGILMYELVSGINPFVQGCTTPAEAMVKTLRFNPQALENCSSNLSKAITWCMKKQAHRRPPNPQYILELLKGGNTE